MGAVRRQAPQFGVLNGSNIGSQSFQCRRFTNSRAFTFASSRSLSGPGFIVPSLMRVCTASVGTVQAFRGHFKSSSA
jgi:hypothetical protein